MISVRDLDKILSLMRRVYDVIVIDTMVGLDERTLALLDASDTIIEIVTFDSTTIHNTLVIADTFRPSATRRQGPLPRQPGRLVGRHRASRTWPRRSAGYPSTRVVSDGRLVVQSNNEGVPFVLADPSARISQDVAGWSPAPGPRPASGRSASLT